MSRVLPVLFNGDMVRAILGGRKTVTRRVIKFPVNSFTERIPAADDVAVSDNTLWSKEVVFSDRNVSLSIRPPYSIGDILYIRETWAFIPCVNCNMGYSFPVECHEEPATYEDRYSISEGCFIYREDFPEQDRKRICWSPSIHMPKQAARIWLKVRNLKAERLQDISETQAAAEGAIKCYEVVRPDEAEPVIYQAEDGRGYFVPGFKAIWNSTIKKPDIDRYGWDANPWVWVIEFERCGKPESEG